MFIVSATGPRQAIEAAGVALSGMDPSPAIAVDTREESRTVWRLDAYAQNEAEAAGCAGVAELVSPELSAVWQPVEEDTDWVTKSLEGLPPILAGRFLVAGSHALADHSPGKTAVLIEAGPAFGTGHHGTTLGCLTALDEVIRRKPPRTVLDLGTGSGVLAIAALKSGADMAIGTDIDAESVRVAKENSAKNEVAARFQAYQASGTRLPVIKQRAPYDLVFANILARPLIALAPDVVPLTATGGTVILSGLLTHQEPLVRAAFVARGLTLTRRIRLDGWITLVLRKPAKARPQPRRASRRMRRAVRRARMWGRSETVPAGYE